MTLYDAMINRAASIRREIDAALDRSGIVSERDIRNWPILQHLLNSLASMIAFRRMAHYLVDLDVEGPGRD